MLPCALLGCEGNGGGASPSGGENTPEQTYFLFIHLLEQGDLPAAKKLTNGRVKVVSEDPIVETIPYINARLFQAKVIPRPILIKTRLADDRFWFRTGEAYFVLARMEGKWVITEAGMKPIE